MRILQWLHGLERLGHHVIFLEFLNVDPDEATDPLVRYFAETVERWWHPRQSALIFESEVRSLYGLDTSEVARAADDAAGVITLMANYHPQPYPLIEKVRPRILLEADPAYTHLWAAESSAEEIFGHHDIYYTVGANIGTSRCAIPTLGIQWRPLWNPVILDWWPAGDGIRRDRFTTVADWRGYGYLVFAGQLLGPKSEELRRFVELPRLAEEPLELALNIGAEDPDHRFLQSRGWIIDSSDVVSTPEEFRKYVSGSLGEFSCAKGGYVRTHSGWFSDRSACYLAAGRPAVLQATGFEDVLPTGQGLFAVNTVEEAAEALKSVRENYTLHSEAAREIAEEYFDSRKTLSHLLADSGIL
ncbi:MAG TPA: hypothetical protein VFB34_05860 [Chloroflexota bacterium]|nr:hypothetical protein [Chloroflexota bacterium]